MTSDVTPVRGGRAAEGRGDCGRMRTAQVEARVARRVQHVAAAVGGAWAVIRGGGRDGVWRSDRPGGSTAGSHGIIASVRAGYTSDHRVHRVI